MGSLRKKVFLIYLVHTISALQPETLSTTAPLMNALNPGFPTPPAHFADMAKKLMIRCLQIGHRVPTMMDSHFNHSGLEDRMSNPTPFSIFHSLLTSLSAEDSAVYHDTSIEVDTNINSGPHYPFNTTTKYPESVSEWNVTEKMWNCSSLPQFIQLMMNSSASPSCFLRAFIAPLSWVALTMKSGDNMTPEDYGSLLWAVKPFLLNMPPPQMNLPPRIQNPHLEEMMKVFSEVFGSLSEGQRDQIRAWFKEQVTLNHYNCSHAATAWQLRLTPQETKPTPTKPTTQQNPRPTPTPGLMWPASPPESNITVTPCPSSLVWLNVEEMKMMGPFISGLPIDDINTIPKDQLCLFFHAPQFPTSFSEVLPPLQANKILEKVKDCSQNREDFMQNLNRLGSLACFYDYTPTLNSSMSLLLLTQLSNCSNTGADKLKKILFNTVMSSVNYSSPELLHALGSGVTALSPSHLSLFPPNVLKDALMSLGSEVKWSLSQAKTLVKTILQGKKDLSGNDLLCLGSAVRGVSSTVLQNVKPQGLLGNERLDVMSQLMTSLQRKALLEGFRGDVNASELVQKVPASLLSSLSLTTLDQADLTSLSQLEGKQWTCAQSAFLVGKILSKKITHQDLRKLGSAMQGVTCQMIRKLSENGIRELEQTVTETSHWLSITQVCCTAHSLFAGLEKERAGYFNNITGTELAEIPTLLLVHLPAEKIASLPASVCPVFLEKMKMANLSSLPLSSSLRPALMFRALACLGRNMSKLSSEEVLSLGPLLCELPPSQMALLAPKVLNSTLQALASCTQIPQSHHRALFQLLNVTYGDPSYWTADIMESLGPLLLLDDSAVRSLPYKTWLKNVLSDLMVNRTCPSPPPHPEFRSCPDLSALQWKLFTLSTSTLDPVSLSAEMPARRKRAVVPLEVTAPFVLLVEELGDANVYWSPAQLLEMNTSSFMASVEMLGKVLHYNTEQLSVLREKAIEAWGPVSGLNESQLLQLGCVVQGFNLTELHSLPLSSLDALEIFARCPWTQPQREAVWRCFMHHINKTVGELGAVDLVGLDQFICGLNAEEIGQLSTDAFREAVQSVGQVKCPLGVAEQLKKRAVAVFGDPQGWTEAHVNSLGNIMAGLSPSEFHSLSPSVFSFLSPTCIPLIPPDRLAALSATQLEALGLENAAMVTDEQKAGLAAVQLIALRSALGVANNQAEVPQDSPSKLAQSSGASMLGTLGVGVFLQPFLFMILGFFL
ncbi:hypothetical protein UPYG_G00156120 [Umbra pygmaea]|uniref:Otoancorin n=1 Tax=Umbra pygmaea TaxID=75934 RepID=A0ABD0XEB2_UMBPY